MRYRNFLNSFALLIIVLFFGSNITLGETHAADASKWKAGRIIDDALFLNPNDMSVSDIQNFLNSKVPVCDTSGTQPASEYGRPDLTHAQYAASRGWPSPPYVCLRNYYEVPKTAPGNYIPDNSYNHGGGSFPGGVSAAQLIYDAAQKYGISNKALLVKLATESAGPLTTDTWPFQKQYTYAMGAHCPDSGPGGSANCDINYSGFSMQISEAASLLRWYIDSMTQSWWQYKKPYQVNSILWNVEPTGCGAGNVYLETKATAALYTYTPYQPNQAALNNMYGTGDGCSAYGNRNFWRVWVDWFGSPVNDAYSWELIQDTSTGKIYLVSNRVKHWVPGPSLMAAWGLNNIAPRQVDSNYVSLLNPGPDLTYVGLDISGNRYLMSGGKRYLLANDNYVLIWGVAGINHISAPGLVQQIPQGGSAGRFATDAATGATYLLGGSQKYTGINPQSLQHWGQTASNTTIISSDVLARLPTGIAIDRYISSGNKHMIVDQSKVLTFKNSELESAWGSRGYVDISPYALNLLSKVSASNLAINQLDGRWYFLEGGRKHYISYSQLAQMWGWTYSNPLTPISDSLASELSTSTNLAPLAKNSDGNVYIADGTKHLVDPNYQSSWIGTQQIPTFTKEAFDLLPSGKTIKTSIVGFTNHARIYIMDNGELRYIPGPNVLDALGGYRNNPIITLDQILLGRLVQGGAISGLIKSSSDGTEYYPENGYLYTLDPAYVSNWSASTASIVSKGLLDTLTDTGTVLNNAVSVDGAKYLMNSQSLLNVTYDYQNYGLADSDFVPITRMYYPVSQKSSYLVGTPGSAKIWLLSMGKRYYISSPNVLYDLGYGTRAGIVSLNSSIMTSLPEYGTTAGTVLKGTNSGPFFASVGNAYGFKDSTMLQRYSAGKLLTIPSYYTNGFAFVGWTSQLVTGSSGKIYFIENGQKRWVTGPSLLEKYFSGQRVLGLPDNTINALPTGDGIIN